MQPEAAGPIRPTAWLEAGGTLHVVAPDAEAASVAPLTAAFVDEIVVAARRLATSTPGGRLDPPLRLVLDELANIAPLPKIGEYLADGGGRGIQLAWFAQSRHQLSRRFGQDTARIVLDATSILLVGGGLADTELLRDLSALLGQVQVRDHALGTTRDGATSWSEQLRDRPVLDPAELFALPRFHALMLAAGAGTSVVKLQPWWERPDARAFVPRAPRCTPAPSR